MDSNQAPLPAAWARVSAGGSLGKPDLIFLLLSVALYVAAARFVTSIDGTLAWIGLYLGQWSLYGWWIGGARWGRRKSGQRAGSGGEGAPGASPASFTPWTVLAAALIFRLGVGFTTPWLSDDLYRYLLDGRVLASGINPFRYAPASEVIRSLQPVWSALVNHPDVPTIYPPVAQAMGLLAAWLHLGVDGWRVWMSLVDLGAIVAVSRLFGGGPEGWKAAAVYGLCPLAVWESGANGHLEPMIALLLVSSLVAWRTAHPVRAGGWLAASALVKLFPLALVPLFVRRRGFWLLLAASTGGFLLGWLPFVAGGVDVTVGLRTYLAKWSFNSPVHAGLEALFSGSLLPRLFPFAFIAAATAWAGLRRVEPVRAVPFVLFGFLLSGPTLQPWYALWLLPFLGPRPHLGLWFFVGAMGLSYEVWWEVAQRGTWRIAPAWNVIIWTIVLSGWVLQGRRR